MEKTQKENSPEVKEELKIKEVKPKRKKRSKKFLLLYVAVFGFAVYAAFTIINQNIEINNKKAQLEELNKQIEVIEIQNDYLSDVKNYTGKDLDDYIENIAREDLDYIKNGERVFINVSGD
jgi:cell division protein DivIC